MSNSAYSGRSNRTWSTIILDFSKGVELDPDRVIGLFLDQNLSLLELEGTTSSVESDVSSGRTPLSQHWREIMDRANHIIDTMLRSHDHFIAISHPSNVCHIPVKGYGTMEFHLDVTETEALVLAGQEAMRACLAERGVSMD